MAQDTTVSGFDAALKEVYIGGIREQINQKTRLLDLFTKGDIEQYEWEGREVVLALHKSRNSGVKATAESGILPAAGKQGYANLKIPMRFVYGRMEFTAQVMKAARSDKGSFARVMDSEQKGLVNDVARQRNRALSYYGSGTLAVIASGTASATQTVKDPGGVVGTTNPLRFLPVGTVVAITDSLGTTLRGVQTISSVSGTNTIVLDGSVTTTTGDLVSLGSNATSPGESSFGLEPMGILGIADQTTYVASIFGIDRSNAANSFFLSQVLSSVGNLSPDLLQRVIDNTEEVSSELVDFFVSHSSLRREYLKLTEGDRRYAGGSAPISPDAGSKVNKSEITFDAIPFKVDKDFAYGILVGGNKSHLYWIPETEGEWVDEDGSILFRKQNQDNFEARYRLYENFFSDKGNSLFRMDGVNVTVTSGVFSL